MIPAYPDPWVKWRKDGGGLRENAKVLQDNSIEINPTTTADQGLFGCEASNPFGTDYQASSLVLIGAFKHDVIMMSFAKAAVAGTTSLYIQSYRKLIYIPHGC